MNKTKPRVSSTKGGRKKKAGASGAGKPRRAGRRFDRLVERWYETEGTAFTRSRSSLIPMLQAAQTSLGYLPADAMRAIAQHLMMPPASVEGVASFYAQFRFNKPGRHRITICTGTACYVRGSGAILGDLQTDLGIPSGQTTADGEVSLESVSCFGACALAPVVVLDDKVLRQQTSDGMKKVLQDIYAEAGPGEPCGTCAPASEGGGK